MKRIIVHSEAELELWQAVEYYETKSVGLGLDFEQEVSRASSIFRKHPIGGLQENMGRDVVCSVDFHMLFTIWNFKILFG